jgi:tRNA A-37 threonylcarbamoyl transferase component Bud32
MWAAPLLFGGAVPDQPNDNPQSWPAKAIADSTGDELTEPAKLPLPPAPSRVDMLPDSFSALLSRRPHFIGDIIANRYKLVEHLGDGGMGQVFTAENLAIGSRVAIKVLKAELLADAHFRQRFQTEAQAIAAIDHRNVVRFLDLVVGDPTFLVMEYVPGQTLAQVLAHGKKIEPVRAINLTRRLCWGLDAVHKAGIIHRDLKPANVILTPDSELGEEPKIIDFGLAKLAYARPEQQLTREGQILGTPHYMAPEQIANREIDARADVYSLGCLFYHMLAGRPPFEGRDDVTVLFQQIQEAPAQLKDHAPGLSPELEAVLRKALAKDPKGRYSSALEMARALSAVDRRAPSKSARKVPLWPLLALGVSLVVLLVAVFLAVGSKHPKMGGTVLVVSSRPSGASVEIDGNKVAETTPAVLGAIAPGQHRLRVSAQRYSPLEQVVSIGANERLVTDVALAPATRAIEVQTMPAGALLYLDGRPQVGETPLRIEVAEDDFHELRIEKAGFVPVTRALKPEDSFSALSIELVQEKEPRGVVWVDSNSAARVFIDGNDTGLSAPTVGMVVSVGAHRVELRDSVGRSIALTRVDVAQGDSIHLTLDGCAPPAETGKPR